MRDRGQEPDGTATFAQHTITAAQQREFDRLGYLLLPRALSPPHLHALRRFARRLQDRAGTPAMRALDGAARRLPWFRARQPIPVALGHNSVEFQNVLGNRAVRLLVDQPTVLPAVAQLLGWNIYVYLASLVITPPVPVGNEVPPGPSGWHQDSSRVNDDLEGDPRPRLSVKVAYFLTDTRVDNGANLWIIPGSHRRNARPSTPSSRLPTGAWPIQVPAGTAVIFDRRLWHSASPNVSDGTRVVIFVGYAYRWLRPHDTLFVTHLRRGADPVRRQLLGAGSDATSFYSPSDGDVPLRALCQAVRNEEEQR